MDKHQNVNQPQGSPVDSKRKNSAKDFFIPDLCTTQSVFFLVLVGELLSIVLELAGGSLQKVSWQHFALTSLFVQWSMLLSAALLCQLRPRLSGWPIAYGACLCYLLIIAVVAVTSVMGQGLLSGGFNGIGQWSMDYGLWGSHILICAVLAGIALRYLYLTEQLRLNQRAELQARIQALQSRIRPHFLFNSMNSIASLIAVDQEAAEQAVEDLAALFRASLAEVETEVSLAQELELCRHYARIEQLRLGQRLQIEWRVDDVPASIRVPSLSLQPLIENAIYHGIGQLPEGGKVEVNARFEQGMVTLSVINPVQEGDSEYAGNHLAKDNIHRRLQALYGPKASLTTSLVEQQYTACIVYPLDQSDANAK